MSAADHMILADWGTSCLRASLCRQNSKGFQLVSTVQGPGVKNTRAPEETFFSLVGPWLEEHGKLPSLLCGTIGSNIGWVNTPYVECPAVPGKIGDSLTRFEARGCKIAIVPGLTCRNPLGMPDILRGEETQILGWLLQLPPDESSARLVCLPGTHTKWALVKNGRVEIFLTGMQGELFDILQRHSMLLPKTADATPENQAAAARDPGHNGLFDEGLRLVLNSTQATLIHTLFAVRSRAVRENLSASQAREFLSGQTIGADVKGAIGTFRTLVDIEAGVTLIGTPELNERYATALNANGVAGFAVDGAAASLAGLYALYHQAVSGRQAA
jgi:2-dehydro-3-deoxygalactonokinase